MWFMSKLSKLIFSPKTNFLPRIAISHCHGFHKSVYLIHINLKELRGININLRIYLFCLVPFAKKKGAQDSQKAFANPERPERKKLRSLPQSSDFKPSVCMNKYKKTLLFCQVLLDCLLMRQSPYIM